MKVNSIYVDIIYFFTILLLIVLIIWDVNFILVVSPILLFIIGLSLVFSRRFKNKFFFENFFYWISCNLFLPRYKYNYMVWGILFIFLGITSIFYSAKISVEKTNDILPSINDYHGWWYKDPVLWIVIMLLIGIGLYRSKRK